MCVSVCVGVVTGKLLTFHNITLSFTVRVQAYMFAGMQVLQALGQFKCLIIRGL